ncbi:MAG: hypothetical protein AAF438_04980 [Pseudomonadota bacterium]
MPDVADSHLLNANKAIHRIWVLAKEYNSLTPEFQELITDEAMLRTMFNRIAALAESVKEELASFWDDDDVHEFLKKLRMDAAFERGREAARRLEDQRKEDAA